MVPFVAMNRFAVHTGDGNMLSTLVTARTPADLPYQAELASYGAQMAFSRTAGPGQRIAGRLAAADLVPLLPADGDATYFICGSAGFAEHATGLLLGLGIAASRIKVERFGPTS